VCSKKIFDTLTKIGTIERASLDEAYIDVTESVNAGMARHFENANLLSTINNDEETESHQQRQSQQPQMPVLQTNRILWFGNDENKNIIIDSSSLAFQCTPSVPHNL
jgi:nucleotidyltransferase/DNA polymerase involved in DNA repair